MRGISNGSFKKDRNYEIYVDKTELITYTNQYMNTEHRNICVTRPRRFGKSMVANMLTAYYSRGCDSENLFSGFKISGNENFNVHLNKYNVIHLNIQQFMERTEPVKDMIM